jgi:uncharacterized protein (DUF433 family)
MSEINSSRVEVVPLGIGYYTVPEAALLLRAPAVSIRRWLGGYSYAKDGERKWMPPLWQPQIPIKDKHIEIGFRDLIELRFVYEFTKAGVGLKAIRHCLRYARECVNDDRPFSTHRFQTDGRTIFLEGLRLSGEAELLDLKKRQYVFKQIIEGTFKDLDIEHDAVSRWRPFGGKQSIVIDPERSFGQPIAATSGVPTVTLAEAVVSEGSVERVSYLYEVSTTVIRDAVQFEKELLAA